ncbi:hypothetical protein ONE63_002826 [Megalurothrips usitatus]|uniref:MULE transposase domain-containing protein n=1 Tax=Megalurothrips usitatus TaxID=439358 RepID=A0AAV7X664_9NEOP|nr:hypothetical protein ONE63_002826 [Megalurothrips usitatus]
MLRKLRGVKMKVRKFYRRFKMRGASFWLLWSFFLLTILADVSAVRLIRENGFRPNTYYYHLGDGGHAYHFNTETSTSIYFKCVLYGQGCKGRAILRVGGNFRHTLEHNHPPDPDFVGERHFRENLLQRISTARYVDFKDVLDDMRRDRKYSKRVRAKMNRRRLSSVMARVRSQNYPPIPGTLRDLTRTLLAHKNVSKTADGLENLYAGSVDATDGSHHVAFFSPRMRAFMGNVRVIQGDGTFRARPAVPHSCQCFVIVTTWRHNVVPLGWFLMERKTLAAYRAVFHLLKTICPQLNPSWILSDWEYAQQLAWEEEFPNAQIQGCLWHLCRAFLKKANTLKILRFKSAVPGLLGMIKKACGICLLPSPFFEEGLQILENDAREEDVVLGFILAPFFQYVRDRWIHHPRRRDWMEFYNCTIRTNNACETHNKMLRAEVGAYRPNVYAFIEALARMEHNANLDVFNMNQGGAKTRRWKSIYQDQNLRNLGTDLEMDIFHDSEEAVRNFLNQASNKFHGAFMGQLANVLNREDRE